MAILCFHLLYTLCIKTWEDIRERLDEGNHGVPTAICIGLLVILAPFIRYFPTHNTNHEMGLAPVGPAIVARLQTFDLTGLDLRAPGDGPLKCADAVEDIDLRFRVPVEDGFAYIAQIDHREQATIGFRPDGLFTQRVSHTSLSRASHSSAIYRYRLGEKAQILAVKNIRFEIAHAH